MSARPPFNLLAAAQPVSDIASLVPVRQAAIGSTIVHSVSAKDLHAFLMIGRDFSAWIKTRIGEYDFAEHIDYEVFTEIGGNPAGGRPPKEYTIALDMAKEIAMVERNAKGKEARQYFIECERRALAPAAADPLAGLPPEQRALIALMVDNASIKARQDEQAKALADQAVVQDLHSSALEQIGHRVEQIADGQVFTACPSNAESITPIRARINAKYGLPVWVIDQVIAQMPYSLKPAGTVLNGHEKAQGAKYIIYWIRDVSQVFKRFVEECEHTTEHRARHPFVEDDFKLGPGWGKPVS